MSTLEEWAKRARQANTWIGVEEYLLRGQDMLGTTEPWEKYHLSDEQQVAAALLILFAVLNFDKPRYHSWYRYTTDKSYNTPPLEGAVWWSIRFMNDPDDPFVDWQHYLGYLEHICRNRGVICR